MRVRLKSFQNHIEPASMQSMAIQCLRIKRIVSSLQKFFLLLVISR
ncbi:uncharacterized protein CELE_F07H5.13 [Caenorhabditis elegans]|uniref:Uncharacterized protein n=1 Tax=Caenorhabditis elegans TaxID=6239 RepID=Q95QM7_CAEEL|nr:Uncharacterized protein CELE_F07H5.13 [Caenorhabditis elegans]CAC70082.1 Uncharacterized protein CELE_F07H5.13 [Caenorhabditis elegans]|eukprot:NP_495870.1 Uncharacterized protein CELE_F07H5.13 [Caenorhabditis elegans]